MNEKSEGASKSLVFWGTAASLIWVAIVAAYLLFAFDKISKLPPDELSTFVAGVFSPLAFLWLVLGFFQQGEELRLQAMELRSSVEQQRALVAVTREQIDHEREARALEEAELRRKAKPVFALQDSGHTGGGSGHRVFNFLIVNAGATCSDVRLFDDSGKSHGGMPIWQSGTGASVVFEFLPGQSVQEKILTIECLDALQTPISVQFKFTICKVGTEVQLQLPATSAISKVNG